MAAPSATLIRATASGELSRPVCCKARSTQADKDIVTDSVPRQSNSTAFTGTVTASASHRRRSAPTTNGHSHPVPAVEMHDRRQKRTCPWLRSQLEAEPAKPVRRTVPCSTERIIRAWIQQRRQPASQ
jgi:hypothetical protein